MANPVFQRELVAHLRAHRSFALQAVFVLLLGALVAIAWPTENRVAVNSPEQARRLVDLFFIGQFLLASLTTPVFAAGALTGEKERKTYEMLLASALRPAQIVGGKWAAALLPSVLLIISTLPIVMLCLPLGGVSLYEVLAAYVGLLAALTCFSMVSIWCSAKFARTTAALATAYLFVLPPALIGVFLWQALGSAAAGSRIVTFIGLVPIASAVICSILFLTLTRLLRFPPDVGSEGRDVIDEQQELREAVGLIIQRDQFPDRLFAPAKRTDLLPDDVNPVLDKELRSELFSQGTLMLRLVIQASLLLAVPLMGACLYFQPRWAPWYLAYVLLFNMLTAPVFCAGAVSSERERQTLDLLLVTTLKPGQILWGKLFSGLRVSTVLTMFLMWPVVLACVFVPDFYPNLLSFVGMTLVVCVTCLVTAVVSLFCSVSFRKSYVSLTTAYLALGCLFLLPQAADYFMQSFLPESAAARVVHSGAMVSPFAAVFAMPLDLPDLGAGSARLVRRPADWPTIAGYFIVQALLVLVLLRLIVRMFRNRYDAAAGI